MLVFSAVGAPLTGISRDMTGSFVYAWVAGTVLLVVALVLLLVTPAPAHRIRAETESAAAAIS
jgi:cyanate permease